MRVKEAQEGERLRAATVYIAPPNKHLLVSPDFSVVLGGQEQVQYVRPSADILFESAASRYGKGVVAVVLSGSGQDGARGIRAVNSNGGMSIAQDKATSEYFGMPGAAIATGVVNYVLPLDRIAAELMSLVEGTSG